MNNTLWITKIQSYIPKHMGQPVADEVSKTYQRVFDAFHEVNETSTDLEKAPVEDIADSDEMAGKIVGQLLNEGVEIEKVQILCDCRSSITGKVPAPSYHVAVLNDIKNVLPFSIQGQAGTEGMQALVILQQMMKDKNLGSGVVSLVQKLNKGDKRVEEKEYILGDGGAGLFIERQAQSGYEILGITMKREDSVLEKSIVDIVNELCEKAGISLEQIAWSICQNVSEPLKQQLPTAVMYNRKEQQCVNFGCGDTFITLGEMDQEAVLSDNDIVLMLSVGKTNHIGAMLLRYRKG